MTSVNTSLYGRRKESKLNIVLNFIIAVIIIVIIIELAFGSTYSGIYVVESSMRPTLIGAESENVTGGDYVYVNRKINPDYGDIVVVFKDENSTIIKRVIAFGGDSVKLVAGQLYVKYSGSDGFVLVDEPYVAEENNSPGLKKNSFPLVNGAVAEEGYYVEEGTFFLLGDNRNVSADSREHGSYPVENLYGVVTDWSLKHKSFLTAMHKYFTFDLPACFGL